MAVFNMLPTQTMQLIHVHCKSKDDDLGTHIIANGDRCEFSFNVNIFQTTLIFCGIGWSGGLAVFNGYKARRDLERCLRYCMWDVKAAGGQGFRDGVSNRNIVIP
ncbi:S-protein homolog 24-like [Punica granatum]|uniref:S-protein homolog n=1 Tax=Punica granatum TaxID=22663 RepID=A0A6P8BV40_PUNGR|nr:S-protein homolog 24-like [Punica granatum]